jgi:hypothetical protein
MPLLALFRPAHKIRKMIVSDAQLLEKVRGKIDLYVLDLELKFVRMQLVVVPPFSLSLELFLTIFMFS